MRKRPMCLICLPLLLWLIWKGITGSGIPDAVSWPWPEGSPIEVRGTVYKMEQKSSSMCIYLKNISILSEVSSQIESLPKCEDQRLLVYLKEKEELHIGNQVQVSGSCAYFAAPDNPGEFDAVSFYGAQKIVFSLKKAAVEQKDSSVDWIGDVLYQMREKLGKRLDLICSGECASVLKAMLLGDKSDLEQETKELYQSGGIIHILAISGLHISLLGMGIYGVFRRIGISFVWSGVWAGVIMMEFCMMTGSATSAKRAVLMFLIFLGSQAVGRTYDMPTALMLAAVAILMKNPYLITQAGFLLSFAAVAGVLASDIWDTPLMRKSGLSVSISTFLFTLPLVAWFYYQIPVWGIFLNLLILPLMPAVMISGAAGIIAGFLASWFGRFCAAPAQYILGVTGFLCDAVQSLPGSDWICGRPSAVQIGVYYLFLLIFCCFFRKKRKIDLIQRAFGIILIITILFFRMPEKWTMTFLNVGQGDGICIRMPEGIVWMVDGGSSSKQSLGSYTLQPYLKYQGIDQVDCWMISHFDQDHVSGLAEILEGYEKNLLGRNASGITIGQILIPDAQVAGDTERDLDAENSEKQDPSWETKILTLAEKHKIPVCRVSRGDNLRQGETYFRILAPEKDYQYEEQNEASMVVEVCYGSFRALLTGDLENAGEEQLLEAEVLQNVDVLKVAHHGSKNGSSEAFLTKVLPEAAVISCGFHNRYGHPHGEVLKRLQGAGSEIIRIDQQGAVEIVVEEDNWYIRKAN